MSFPRITNVAWLAVGAIASAIGSLLPIIILVILFFMGKGMIIKGLESFLPHNVASTVTNLLLGFLIFYFVLKFFTKR